MSAERRRSLAAVLAMLLVGAVAELVALGAVLPFLSLLASPERAREVRLLRDFLDAVGATSPSEIILVAAGIFAGATLFAGAVRLVLAWYSQAFVFKLGHEIGIEIQRRILGRPYTFHIANNTSETIAALEKIQLFVWNVLMPAMLATTSLALSAFIIAVLVYVDPVIAASAAAFFGATYLVVSSFTKDRLASNSTLINEAYAKRVQAVQESLGGIRDILIDRSQALHVEHFRRIDARLRRAQAVNSFIGTAPRYAIEALGMILIAALATMLTRQQGGLAGSLPTLGLLAIGAQRLLPLLQQVYYGWAQLRGNTAVAIDVAALYELPPPSAAETEPASALPFERTIALDDVTFAYPGRTEPALRTVSLTIGKGQRVGVIGKTGSGKSTLIDLLMGLLKPDQGEISIDGHALTDESRPRWQMQIAHVPQSVFLSDTSLANNIALKLDSASVDLDRVREAGRRAQLDEFVSTLPDGYDTQTGERGVRLSGGQRQRLGLARALYKRADVLILDEATSALDDETESAVMQALDDLQEQLTIVMIAHRLSTLARCDTIIRMENGAIAQIGTYEEVVKGERRAQGAGCG